MATITWEYNYNDKLMGYNWVDISEDVLSTPMPSLRQGMRGFGPRDHVADQGKLVFYLDNSATNSQSTLGYYYDGTATTEFTQNTIIRISITESGSTKKYRFYIEKIEPVLGQARSRRVKVTCYDYIGQLARMQGASPDLSPNGASQEAYSLGVDATYRIEPKNLERDTAIDLDFPALFYDLTESSNGLSGVQSICESSLAYVYIKPDSTDGETWVYESRRHRGGQVSYDAQFDNDMVDLTFPAIADNAISDIDVDGEIAVIDSAATTELWTLTNEIELAAGETKVFWVNYRNADPGANEVLGNSIVTSLVASTHYQMSSTSGDSGSDLNSDLSATLTPSGWADRAKWTLENTGSSTGYVNLLKVIGKGLYIYDAVRVNGFTGPEAKSTIGQNFYSYRYPYYHSDAMTAEIGELLTDKHSTGWTAGKLTFVPTHTSALMTKWMNTTIGSFIKVNETIKDVDTGAPTDFYVHNETVQFLPGGHIRVAYGLDYGDGASNYLLVDPSGNYITDPSGNGIYGREWIQ